MRNSRPHTAVLATWHAWQDRQARDCRSRSRQSHCPRLMRRSHITIDVGCWSCLGRTGGCGCTRGGSGEGCGWGRSCSGRAPLEKGGLGGTVVLMVLLLLLLLLVVMVMFALVVMWVDGYGGDGRHHSSCYGEHWDGLRRDEQRKGSRYGARGWSARRSGSTSERQWRLFFSILTCRQNLNLCVWPIVLTSEVVFGNLMSMNVFWIQPNMLVTDSMSALAIQLILCH